MGMYIMVGGLYAAALVGVVVILAEDRIMRAWARVTGPRRRR